MLTSIYIENIALIQKLNIDFQQGLTVLTGETGVGKSIIIDSLSLLCGGRSDREIIRSGADYALSEGVFEVFSKETVKKLEAEDIFPDDDGCYYLSRKVNVDGKSSAKINGRTVPASKLRTAASYLMAIHGQQDTQSLSNPETHLGLLDSYGGNSKALEEYRFAYDIYKILHKKIEKLEKDRFDFDEKLDLLNYQIIEIESAKLKPDEESDLENEKKQLLNAGKIIELTASAYERLYGDRSAVDYVREAYADLQDLSDVLSEVNDLAERLESCRLELADIAESVIELNTFDNTEPELRLDKIEERLVEIARLKRKYRLEPHEFLLKLQELKNQKLEMEYSGEELAILKKEKESALTDMEEKAKNLTTARKSAAFELEKIVEEHLADLDMPGVSFKVKITEKPCESDGSDEIEFLISPNKGEDLKPIAKIASGGELSRIMLSIKSAFSKLDGIETVIFDEIDTGISGKTSEKIGLKLKNLSSGEGMQILCVTHSAQIASVAAAHLLVTKKNDGERTFTTVSILDYNGRIIETARIIGGINITEAILAAAEELIINGNKEYF